MSRHGRSGNQNDAVEVIDGCHTGAFGPRSIMMYSFEDWMYLQRDKQPLPYCIQLGAIRWRQARHRLPLTELALVEEVATELKSDHTNAPG